MASLLARDLPVKDLYARPHVFWDKDEAAHDLAAATGADERRLRAASTTPSIPMCWSRARSRPATEARVMHLGLPGLEFEPSGKRYYPDGRNAAQVLGVTDPDNNGVSGLELGLQDKIRAAADGKPSPPPSTCACNTSWRTKCASRARPSPPHAAGGIVMDVRTGEVLAHGVAARFRSQRAQRSAATTPAATSWPRMSMSWARCSRSSPSRWRWRITPRSLDEVFPIGQGYKIGKYTIHEAEHMPATLAARDILAQSSNIGTAQIALRSGRDAAASSSSAASGLA